VTREPSEDTEAAVYCFVITLMLTHVGNEIKESCDIPGDAHQNTHVAHETYDINAVSMEALVLLCDLL